MTEEKKIENGRRKVLISPVQEKLLALLSPTEAKDYAQALKTVHHLATYYVDAEIVDLQASQKTQLLYETLLELSEEKAR